MFLYYLYYLQYFRQFLEHFVRLVCSIWWSYPIHLEKIYTRLHVSSNVIPEIQYED